MHRSSRLCITANNKAVVDIRFHPRCRCLANSTKQRFLTSDWCIHLANWTKHTSSLIMANLFHYMKMTPFAKLEVPYIAFCTVVRGGRTQYSIRPNRSAIRAQAVYFLHSTMPGVTCLRISDVIVIWRVTYFQFPIHSAFFIYRSTGSTCTAAYYWFYYAKIYRTSDVAENLGRCVSCTDRTVQGKDLNWF